MHAMADNGISNSKGGFQTQSDRGMAPGNVVEDIVKGASSIKVASQEQVAEAAVVVQRDVAACSRKFNTYKSGTRRQEGWPMLT